MTSKATKAGKGKAKLEFAFWELFSLAKHYQEKNTGGEVSTSAAAYSAILAIHGLQNCKRKVDFEKKSIQEIIFITRYKKTKEKVYKSIDELFQAAKNFKGKNTGPKTFLGRLRRQALTELKHISYFTYVSELHEETDRGESVFSLSPPHSQLQPNDIDIYDREMLHTLLSTKPLRRGPRPPGNGGSRTRMKPLF